MKIEQLIVQYLYLHKSVTLEQVGTFHLSADVTFQEEGQQPAMLPDNSIRFELNKKAKADEGLIAFIVEKTRKFKPLAVSDLESFTMLGKQFLNLGKPFVIRDLGVLLKNQNEEYEFTQTQTLAAKHEPEPVITDSPKLETTYITENDPDFITPSSAASSKKWMMPAIMIIAVAGILGGVLYYFNKAGKSKDTEIVATPPAPVQQENTTAPATTNPPVPDTTATTQAPPTVQDTTPAVAVQQTTTTPAPPPPTPAPTPAPAPVKTNTFKVVVREYTDLESAQKGYNALTKFPFGKNLIMYTKDSVNYKLAVSVTAAEKNIPRIKDSVQALFGKKASIDFN